MFQRKQRRFRRHTNDRGPVSRGGGNGQSRLRSHSFSNGQNRNNFRPTLSPEKMFEKYTALAKEATSSGDITLSENYLQHADHFIRIIEDRNKNRNQNKISPNDKIVEESKNLTTDKTANNDTQESKLKK